MPRPTSAAHPEHREEEAPARFEASPGPVGPGDLGPFLRRLAQLVVG